MIETTNLESRIEKCEGILKENPNSQVFAPLADTLRMQGDLDQAFRICQQGIRIHPDYGGGHLVMAKINLSRKMYDWAEKELEDAIRCDGDTRVSSQLQVEIAVAKGKLEKAEMLVQKLKNFGGNQLYINDLIKQIKRKQMISQRETTKLGNTLVNPQDEQIEKDSISGTTQRVRQKKIYTIESSLEELLKIDGVKWIVCAHQDGVVVSHAGEFDLDVEEITAFATEISRANETETAQRFLGKLEQVSVMTKDIRLHIVRFKRYNLVMNCKANNNFGALRLLLDEIADGLQES